MLHTIWSYIEAWFSYVSWCMSASDMACRPFLAFVAVLGASAGTLVLLCLALSTLLHDLAWGLEYRRQVRRSARQTAIVHEKMRAHATSSSGMPEVRTESCIGARATGMGLTDAGWREVSVAAATLNPPSPPML
jgi:hypothetical protein